MGYCWGEARCESTFQRVAAAQQEEADVVWEPASTHDLGEVDLAEESAASSHSVVAVATGSGGVPPAGSKGFHLVSRTQPR